MAAMSAVVMCWKLSLASCMQQASACKLLAVLYVVSGRDIESAMTAIDACAQCSHALLMLLSLRAWIQGFVTKKTVSGCAHTGGCITDHMYIHLGILAVNTVQPEEARRPAFADTMKAHLQRSL